ncbi:cytosine deaminase [Candidatus Heimdallarchaeota archaeon B3_Heim]|nr:MAG: cytosine deaminase [Candidatus Heimdallarchaeota archaeon B3_Heim]
MNEMSFVIKNALTREGKLVSIVINQGIITEINKADIKIKDTDYDQVLDAEQSLVTESLISPHIHLDKVLIGDIIEPNQSGTLWEAIQKTWEVKRKYTVENIKKRASEVIHNQIKFGVTHIRTHVDIDSIGGLMPLKGLLATKEAFKDIIDLQIVAFPQEGILKDEGTEEMLEKALELGGMDMVLGGMPHNEFTEEHSKKHVNILLSLAKKYDVSIDSHTDETDDPNSRTLQYLAARAIDENYQGKITVDHICALSSYDNYHAARVIELVKKARINVVTNPPTNMVLQGRLDTGAQRVGITRVKELLSAGVNVTVGQDCVHDPYYPFGNGDMLEVANLLGHAAKMTTISEIDVLYDTITKNAAKTMDVEHQLTKGAPADLVVLHGVKNVHEAIRTTPPARTTIKNGKIISQTSVEHNRFY